MVTPAPDVLVLGEILVELTAQEPLRNGAALRLGFSGDALNAAAAAAAAGAHTCLVARVPEDELGDELVARVAALGIDTSCLIRTPGQHGLYLQHADPSGQREFVYLRGGSAGSSLAAADVPEELAAGAGVVLSSGVACAISTTTFEAVRATATAARCFVYDPNWRPRLVDADTAAGHLRALAPYARLVTPAWPREAAALLGDIAAGPVEACAAFRALGAGAVALTKGDNGVLLDDGGQLTSVPAYPAGQIVDQTGAGDVLAGTVAARLALGDDLPEAIRLGAAAAALSLRGQGGTGYLPDLAESRRLVRRTGAGEVSG